MHPYEDVNPLFTAKKANQLKGMFVFYCIETFCIVYCIKCLLILLVLNFCGFY